MRARVVAAMLLLGLAGLRADAVNVFLRSAEADCGVPVTLPLSVVNQNGNLRTLAWTLEFDPARIAFTEFAIDPSGVLADFRAEVRFPGPGQARITVSSAGLTPRPDGLFATAAFTLMTTEPGPIPITVRDVVFQNGIQGGVESGLGLSGTVTASCPTDRRGHPEIFRFAPFAGSTAGGGYADGEGANARFISPFGVARIGEFLFVTDSSAHVVRRITPDGVVTTWAGAPGVPGVDDGPRSAARFDTPEGIVAMPDGSLMVADRGNSRIRRIGSDGIVSVWAGAGLSGHRDGARLVAEFKAPSVLALEASGSILVGDPGSCTVRRVSVDGVVTIAGIPDQCGIVNGSVGVATLDGVSGILSHPTLGILVADDRNHVVRRIVGGTTVLTHVGSPGERGTTDGLLADGRLDTPRGLAVMPDQSTLVGVTNGVRRFTTNSIETIAGGAAPGWADGVGSAARMRSVSGIVATPEGVVFAAEIGNTDVRRITATRDVSTLAGSANAAGFRDDAGPAARFNRPWQASVDAAGNIYVADRGNRVIRRVSPDGIVTLWAGKPGQAGGVNGPRLEATFDDPTGCVVDASGNVWVSESATHVIRVIRPDGEVVTIAGARGTPGFIDGRGSAARFNGPMQMAVDTAGSVWVADSGNHVIRRISGTGMVATVAGNREGLSGSENGTVDTARFNGPTAVAISPSGRVLIADKGNHAVREIKENVVSTLLAVTEIAGEADGPPPGAKLTAPEGVAVLPDETVIVAGADGRIRRIANTAVSTLAGRYGIPGNQTGVGADTLFASPVSVAVVGARTFVVSDSTNDALVRATRCPDDALCLGGARFDLSLRATDPRTGTEAEGLPLAENDLFGFFSLPGLTGNASNPEVFVKMLDGTGINGRQWVFYGGLTDFAYDLEVYDRESGATKRYEKPGFEFCGGADTSAFAGKVAMLRSGTVDFVTRPGNEAGGCGETALCLRSGRFEVALTAVDPRTGTSAGGVPIPRTADFGYFSLPGLTGNAANPEVFVKVLDGRGVNGKFWVFYGGLTDFEFTLEVTDTESGARNVYVKPGLEFCGGADTNAF